MALAIVGALFPRLEKSKSYDQFRDGGGLIGLVLGLELARHEANIVKQVTGVGFIYK